MSVLARHSTMRPNVRNALAFVYAWLAMISIDRESVVRATQRFWRDPGIATLDYDAALFWLIAFIMTVAFLRDPPPPGSSANPR